VRLLVFDDDEAIGRLVWRIATMTGYEASTVTTPAAFLANLDTMTPDVVVLDLQLGATDGVEQMRVLASHRYAGSLILMSGYDERVLSTTVSLARELGLRVETSLNKPIRVTELEQVLVKLKAARSPITAQRVQQAIQDDEMILELQPIVRRHPNTLLKFEALIRWAHPTKGLIGPGNFIAIAETDVTVMDELTDWLATAVTRAWRTLGDAGVSVPIAMNVSPTNLHDLALPDRLEERLRLTGMPHRHLCLEITESAVFADTRRVTDILTRARLKGFQLAIDDFGTGYSSFKVLRQMPFSGLKIDQQFIQDLAHSRDSQAITKSIIDVAAHMNLECIAEGVETEEVAVMLEQLKVAGLQGYLIALPMPVAAVPAWVREWTGRQREFPTLAVG
jgi:EAL domain-containing protein (putative c-di-GMP-specific phosphodiesterase class I)